MQIFASTAKEHTSRTKAARSIVEPKAGRHDPVTTVSSATIFRKAACACGGGCPSCQSGAGSLKISRPNDAAEIEADAIADRVMRMPLANEKPVHFNSHISESQIQRQPEGETPATAEEPDPIGEGLSTVAENLSENNPAFSELTEDLGNRFRALPTPLSVGVPLFLGANYVGIWTLAMLNPAMRRHLNDFNLGMLPGALVPQFPLKTFTYRILDPEQTRFEFDVGLDVSGIIESIDENSPISTLSLETAGRLNTQAPTGTPPIGLSSLNVNLGLFDDGLTFSGGFRQGVDPYPLLHRDPYTGEGSRIMQQVPGLPDLYPDQRDIRFMLQVDFVKLYNYFNPQSAPIRSVPQQLEGDRIDRQIQRKHDPSEESLSTSKPTESYLASLSGGETLSGKEKQFFESRFGHDFSNVRLHRDSRANESANNVNAVAYTHGNNIVFGRDEYQPGTDSGKRLLAHELAHVIQNSTGTRQDETIRREPKEKPAPPKIKTGPASSSPSLDLLPSINGEPCACLLSIHGDERGARVIAKLLHANCSYNLALVRPDSKNRLIDIPNVGQRDPNELFPEDVVEECMTDETACRDRLKADATATDRKKTLKFAQTQFFLAVKDCSNSFTLPVIGLHDNRTNDTGVYLDLVAKKKINVDDLKTDIDKTQPKEKGKPDPTKKALADLRKKLKGAGGMLDVGGTTNIFRWCNLPDIGKCHPGDPEHPDNVVWVTNEEDFKKLAATNVNVVLQTSAGPESMTDLSTVFLHLKKLGLTQEFGELLNDLLTGDIFWELLFGDNDPDTIDIDKLRFINIEGAGLSHDKLAVSERVRNYKAVVDVLKTVPGAYCCGDKPEDVEKGIEKDLELSEADIDKKIFDQNLTRVIDLVRKLLPF
jgi:hypothetical protein